MLLHTRTCVCLLPPPTFHSTPINSHHTLANSNAGIWSFDMSRGSLPPADSGSCEIEMFMLPMGVVTPTSVNQFVTSSGPPMTMQLDAAIATGRVVQASGRGHLPSDSRVAQKLGRKLTRNFINLSSKEALFCMGAQATGYEKVASGCPDHVTAYYMMIHSKGVEVEETVTKHLTACTKRQAEEWLDTNSILFHHALEYQNKLSKFLKESEEAIEVHCKTASGQLLSR